MLFSKSLKASNPLKKLLVFSDKFNILLKDSSIPLSLIFSFAFFSISSSVSVPESLLLKYPFTFSLSKSNFF
jgi:hypothetical protein